MDERLIEAGIEKGETLAIKTRLAHLGYRASLLLKGPHTEVEFQCAQGGKGINAQHTWKATPMEAIRDGCPHCALDHYVKSAPPTEISEAKMAKAIKAQHKLIHKSNERARRKMVRRGNNYGLARYW